MNTQRGKEKHSSKGRGANRGCQGKSGWAHVGSSTSRAPVLQWLGCSPKPSKGNVTTAEDESKVTDTTDTHSEEPRKICAKL